MHKRPGGEMALRELHFIWLLDASGSMRVDGKIQALNVAIRETIPQLQSAAAANANVKVLCRAIAFSSGARWHIQEPTPVRDLRWTDLGAEGHTDLGQALFMVADALRVPPMPERAVSPVLVLVTDGLPTDDFDGGMAALLAQRWGREAIRAAIKIGRDPSTDALRKFIGNDDIEPLEANNPEALLQQIRWASRSGVQNASQVMDAEQRKRLFDAQQQGRQSSSSVANDDWAASAHTSSSPGDEW